MSFGQPEIQTLINQGLGFGAAVIGETCEWRRPYQPLQPLGPASRMNSLSVYFDPDFRFRGLKPNLYGKPVFGALFDRTATQVGDYLYAGSGTYFIAGQQPLLPTIAVQCTNVITISSPASPPPKSAPAPGDLPRYRGGTEVNRVPVMSGWPALIIKGGREEAGRADLPGDPSMGGYQVLLPQWPGIVLEVGNRVEDDIGRSMVVNLAELTDLGWRLGCTFAEA